MIVKMQKAYVASRRPDSDRLLEALRDLGVVHVAPIDSGKAVATSRTVTQLDHLDRAIQMLAAIEPSGDRPDLSAVQAAEEALRIQHDQAEKRARLTVLARQAEQLQMWGDLRLEQLTGLSDAGLVVQFFAASAEQIGQFAADLVQVVGQLPDGRSLVATVARDGEPTAAEQAEPIAPPETDRPTVMAEAAQIDAELKRHDETLAGLAHLVKDMTDERRRLRSEADYTIAQRSGLAGEDIYAIQGWIPADDADALSDNLAAADVAAAVQLLDADPDDAPPTLVRYPRWVKPIKALFDVLGTTPGYNEYDLSPFFMVALPLFAAMLIGDAGYGLIFTLVGVIGFRRIVAKAGRPAAHLLLVFGVATITWGVLTANYFGVTPSNLYGAGGFLADLGAITAWAGVFWDSNPETARNMVIKISFIFGCIHLVLAHVRAAIGLAPDARALAEIGWSIFLIGMLALVWLLFFPDDVWMPQRLMLVLLGAGVVLIVPFSHPGGSLARRLGLGLIANILPLISTFSDTISYIRLMAVGLASYYIASAFNGLAWQVGSSSVWLIPAAALIVIFAHLLNIALGIIAIFAHGVRLNMLEFSSNAGVQWQGYQYAPFANASETAT